MAFAIRSLRRARPAAQKRRRQLLFLGRQRAGGMVFGSSGVSARLFSSAARKAKKGSDTAKFAISPMKAAGDLPDAPTDVDTVEATKEELMRYLREMSLGRRIEIMSDTLYKQRLIRGFCHLYDGQEAITSGMEAALQPGDSLITGYRVHVTALGRGCSGTEVIAEQMGRKAGMNRGKGGSMHMYKTSPMLAGGGGIVGAQVPVGTGLAFAHKYRGDGGVAVSMYGDGAANQGQIFEAANMAAIWKLPAIFVCENNLYGMGTSVERATSNTNFYERGLSLNVPGVWIDGLDVLAVRDGMRYAANHARTKGPIFVELQTYRFHGHSMSDPGKSYRAREEVSKVRTERDCIDRVKAQLLEQGWATKEELKALDKEIRQQVEEATAEAKASPEPDAEDLYTDVLAPGEENWIRGVQMETSVTVTA